MEYDRDLTHRLVIQLSGSLSGATLKNPQNIIYDFIPATGAAAPAAREIVKIENCNECHNKLAFHGSGGRIDTRYCVVCHTDQRKIGRPEATTTADGYSGSTYRINDQAMGDFPRMIHQIHRGHNLSKTGYNYGGLAYNAIGYPMLSGGEKMCIKCHDGSVNAGKTTAQGDNWKTKPSRLACGSCHDNVNFATGAGHSTLNIVATDDTTCTTCHVSSIASIDTKHWTTDKTKHNPVIASDLASFEYEISSATASATVPAGATGLTATVVFRIKKDGTPATLNTTGALLTGFTSGPNLFMAYARTQDGKSPADYINPRTGGTNGQPTSVSITNLMAGTGGSITGPNADGYYTATINNAFPADATRRAVNIQGTFTQTAVASQGGGNVARHAISVARSVETAANARRTVVDPAKCSNCHEWFKGHGGSRVYETGVCIQCHNPNMTSTGHTITAATINGLSVANKALLTEWGLGAALVGNDDNTSATLFPSISNNFKDLIHNIHKGHDHESPFFNLRGGQAIVYDFSHIKFPGILNDCQTCHVAPTSTNPSYTGVPATALSSTQKAVNAAYAAELAVGGGTRANALASLTTVGTNADDIVTTPFSAACVSCHDNSAAKSHITTQGGGIMVKRANVQAESCTVCHGSGRTYDVTVMHNK